ncbi:MAG: outer membrane protein assembly factor BamA [Rhodobacter sp.]|nr:outer membrane protein assembly factor BamA [Rhodobacter sp.]
MTRALGHKEQLRRKGAQIFRTSTFLFFAVSAMVYLAIAQVAQAQTYVFNSVEIQGNQRIEPATILSYAGIARGEPVSGGQLNAAYQSVLGSGLFETVALEPRGSTLVITVQEYPTINRISIEGNRRLKDEDLLTIIRSQSRRVYSPTLAEQDAALIVQAYEQGGRLAASVDPVIIRRSNNRVDLVFEVSEGRVVEVQRISFVGNRNFSDRRLRRVLESKQAGLFRAIIQRDTFVGDRIEFDKQVLRDFYLSRGYVDFQILSATSEFSRERNAFFITFNVREGQKFTYGAITTVSDLPEIDPDAYQAAIRIRPGQTYTPGGVENTIARLERLAVQSDLDFVRVEPRITRNDRTLTLDIEFAVVRGPRIFVERIDIEGNATTLDRVIRRQFRSVEGDPFNPREIRESAERIRALGFFSKADVNAREGSATDRVVVDVDVEEQPTGSLGFGATYSAQTGVGFTASFAERNFLGRGQSISFEIGTSEDTSRYSFGFTEPAFLGRDVAFNFGVSYGTASSTSGTLYDTTQATFSTGLEFPIGEFSRFGFNYELNGTEITNVPAASSAIIDREAARGFELASSLGYSYSYRTLRTGLNPDAGVLFRWSQDFAGVGGDIEFVRSEALVVGETKVLNGDVTLRAILEGGAITTLSGGVTRVTDRYFLNGKMRGFDYFGLGPRDLAATNEDALGGNFFAVARFEADFPLGLPEEYGVSGGVFLDVGTVWDLDDTAGGPIGGPVTAVDDSARVRSAIGFSVFWDTPIGPLRFNFSKALQKEPYDIEREFDLTISTRF